MTKDERNLFYLLILAEEERLEGDFKTPYEELLEKTANKMKSKYDMYEELKQFRKKYL